MPSPPPDFPSSVGVFLSLQASVIYHSAGTYTFILPTIFSPPDRTRNEAIVETKSPIEPLGPQWGRRAARILTRSDPRCPSSLSDGVLTSNYSHQVTMYPHQSLEGPWGSMPPLRTMSLPVPDRTWSMKDRAVPVGSPFVTKEKTW